MGGKKGNKSKKSKGISGLRGKERLQALGRAPKTIGKKSIAPGTTGIGPVADGKAYAKALSKAKNQPSKGTTGVGPFADGAKYAEALRKSPPRFSSGTMEQQKAALSDGTLFAGNYTSPNVKNYGLRPDGEHGFYKTGDIINTGGLSGKDFKFDGKNWNAVGTDTAMLGGDNLGGYGALGIAGSIFGLGLKGIGDAVEGGKRLKENIEKRLNPEESQNQSSLGISNTLASTGDLTGIGIKSTPNYFSIKSPESFGTPSQDAVDKAAGITAGGLNIGGSGFTPSDPSGGANARAVFAGASPNSVLNDPNFKPGPVAGDPFARPGPGGPESEAEYTSYQPGSYYNQSDTDRMNVTNLLRSGRNLITSPLRGIGIDNQFTNMLIPKSNEAIQDARDQRKPVTLTKRKSGGGARPLATVPTVLQEILPEALPVASASTTPSTQTGIDPNRLLQIQQQAYAQAYNPMLIGGFNPQFRFGAATPTIDYSTYFNY